MNNSQEKYANISIEKNVINSDYQRLSRIMFVDDAMIYTYLAMFTTFVWKMKKQMFYWL